MIILHTFVVVPATPTERYTHLFGAFALLPAALLLPAFQSLQLYADLPSCPDDRAFRRHIHLIPPRLAPCSHFWKAFLTAPYK
jgi:hypothetical protein